MTLPLLVVAVMATGCAGTEESPDTAMSLADRKEYCLRIGDAVNVEGKAFDSEYFIDLYQSEGCDAVCGSLIEWPGPEFGFWRVDPALCPHDED